MSQSTKQNLKYRHNVNKGVKKRSLLTGTILSVVIIITPYLYYLYQGVPSTGEWDSFFGTITSNFYGDVQVLMWVLFGKLIPFLLLLIWFFTCKHWWYHAILVPLCMFAFQIYTTLNDDMQFMDSNEFFVLAPIIFVIAIFSYTIRTRVFDKIHGIDLSELSRVNWKGEIKQDENDVDNEDEDEDDAMFMG